MVSFWFVSVGALLLPLAPPGSEPKRDSRSMTTVRMAQVRIQQHIVIRVPRVTRTRAAMSAPAAPLPPIAWVEVDGEKCVKVQTLAGAAITRTDSVDLVLAGGRRMRAKLGKECPSLDFYGGFYVKPTKDGMVCAKRDSFRSRSGGECRIQAFRTLIPSR